MKNILRKNKWGVGMFFVFLLLGMATVAYAFGRSSSSWDSTREPQQKSSVSLYDQGMAANNSGDYQKAKKLFEQALSRDKNNPDIFNMLAHTQLKLGMIDESLNNYRKALALRPHFPEAREYLGETYIQAAMREIETLKSYGANGAEQLEDLVNEFKKAASGL
ncbi:MAG: tetratricopeptide repeat protein [Candidatus Omnitrophica bacterium]|nr:tetratricopeptide repeat protein [Candidatus Omnitrophota bacterium]